MVESPVTPSVTQEGNFIAPPTPSQAPHNLMIMDALMNIQNALSASGDSSQAERGSSNQDLEERFAHVEQMVTEIHQKRNMRSETKPTDVIEK